MDDPLRGGGGDGTPEPSAEDDALISLDVLERTRLNLANQSSFYLNRNIVSPGKINYHILPSRVRRLLELAIVSDPQPRDVCRKLAGNPRVKQDSNGERNGAAGEGATLSVVRSSKVIGPAWPNDRTEESSQAS